MKFLTSVFAILVCAAMASATKASIVALRPGGSLTVTCNNNNLLIGPRLLPVTSPDAAAQFTLTLNTTSSVLTIDMKNTSSPESLAALYAVDFGLPIKVVNIMRTEASFSGFPAGAQWQGPTDNAHVTTIAGSFIFAVRETILGNLTDYLNINTNLSGGFLLPGQGGQIILKLKLPPESTTLLLEPIASFLVPNADSTQPKRSQLLFDQ